MRFHFGECVVCVRSFMIYMCGRCDLVWPPSLLWCIYVCAISIFYVVCCMCADFCTLLFGVMSALVSNECDTSVCFLPCVVVRDLFCVLFDISLGLSFRAL